MPVGGVTWNMLTIRLMWFIRYPNRVQHQLQSICFKHYLPMNTTPGSTSRHVSRHLGSSRIRTRPGCWRKINEAFPPQVQRHIRPHFLITWWQYKGTVLLFKKQKQKPNELKVWIHLIQFYFLLLETLLGFTWSCHNRDNN